jgi:hypothetical protein
MNLSKFFRLLLKLKKILIIFSLLIIHNNVANSATTIIAAGGSTVHLREFSGDVQYSFDNNTWISVSFPMTLTSSSAGDVELNFASGSFTPTSLDYIINNILSGDRLNISYTSGGLPIQNRGEITNLTNFALITNSSYTIYNDIGSIESLNNYNSIASTGSHAIQNNASIGLINNALGSFITGSSYGSGVYNAPGANISNITNAGSITGGWGIENDDTITNITNSGTISGDYYGISNASSINSSIETLTNIGTINGDIVDIDNNGTISTLNNLQGEGNVAGALYLGGTSPLNYNIIIRSTSVYGQLSFDGNGYWTNGGTFNIYGNSGTTVSGVAASTVTNFRYKNILQGFRNLNNITSGQTGTYIVGNRSYNYSLESSIDNIPDWWDLVISGGPIGPSALDTQSSMQYQVSQLRSAFNTQTVAAQFALNYDCNVFDVKGMCISAGGRYTTIDNPNINNSAAVVTLGYKVNANIRVGAYLDQNINISNPASIDISNNTPLMGAYAVWNKEQSGLGYQIRLANTYQDKDVTQTRTIFDTSEGGTGRSSLKSQSYLAELSYAFQYQDKTIVRPYAGLRYTHLKQDSYTEDTTDTVTNPLTVAALRDKSSAALLGVKINRSLTDKATLTAQLGLEQDVHHKVGNYSATNSDIGNLDSVAFNSNIKRTRPVASLGAFYDVTKTQRASATINYQQLPFQSTGSTTAYFNYMIGF